MVAEKRALVSLEDALAAVTEGVDPLGTEVVKVQDVVGRALVGPLRAPMDLPPFDNSAVDGFAIAGTDVQTVASDSFRLVGEAKAGDRARLLHPGETLRIFTGAMIPKGCDAVVMQEDARVQDGIVTFGVGARTGENIRRAGTEAKAGAQLPSGLQANPATLAMLASASFEQVEVRKKPVVAIVATGDELVAPGSTLAPGQIYESNAPALAVAACAMGCEVASVRSVADDRDAISRACSDALESCDVLVTSGGVSVGAHDLVRPVLRELGVEERFAGVAIKPGKPVVFGKRGTCSVFGLPGNPMSALVGFAVLVRPHLLARLGVWQGFIEVSGRLLHPLTKKAGRVELVPANFRDGVFDAFVDRASYKPSLLAAANVLVWLPAEGQVFEEGTEMRALVLDWGPS